MGLSPQEVERIKIAGLFHDIGKIGVPDAILLKDGPLSQNEYEEIKRHPAEGEKILSTCSSFDDILPIIRHHHERVDGRGYPYGLTGDKICLGAKITAVADAFDAMVSNRTYRKGLGFDIAMERVVQGINSQFDAQAVAGLHKLIESIGREEFERKFCSHVNTLE
jgi:HD-GYP domain-containing protein (c-di-GMP phosphodiesterase class II)